MPNPTPAPTYQWHRAAPSAPLHWYQHPTPGAAGRAYLRRAAHAMRRQRMPQWGHYLARALSS